MGALASLSGAAMSTTAKIRCAQWVMLMLVLNALKTQTGGMILRRPAVSAFSKFQSSVARTFLSTTRAKSARAAALNRGSRLFDSSAEVGIETSDTAGSNTEGGLSKNGTNVASVSVISSSNTAVTTTMETTTSGAAKAIDKRPLFSITGSGDTDSGPGVAAWEQLINDERESMEPLSLVRRNELRRFLRSKNEDISRYFDDFINNDASTAFRTSTASVSTSSSRSSTSSDSFIVSSRSSRSGSRNIGDISSSSTDSAEKDGLFSGAEGRSDSSQTSSSMGNVVSLEDTDARSGIASSNNVLNAHEKDILFSSREVIFSVGSSSSSSSYMPSIVDDADAIARERNQVTDAQSNSGLTSNTSIATKGTDPESDMETDADRASEQRIAELISSIADVPHHLTTASDVFCSREVNMEQISCVGFDMDFTLAQYTTEFDLLAFNGAKEKLVSWLGYPKVVDIAFNYTLETSTRRGCIIDKMRGNVLKLDQHRYVRQVNHGLTRLSQHERKNAYREGYQETESFTGSNFANIDTPFGLVDASLFMQLVDLKDKFSSPSPTCSASCSTVTPSAAPSSSGPTAPNEIDTVPATADNSKQLSGNALKSLEIVQKSGNPFSGLMSEEEISAARAFFQTRSYAQLWKDIRRCVDRCHKDGVIKLRVAENPAKYIVKDPQLFPMLRAFKESGRKVFLLTNSLWDYTQVVMNYLEGDKAGAKKDFEWMKYFDLVIVAGNKPAFLIDDKGALALFKVDKHSGSLQNIETLPNPSPQPTPASSVVTAPATATSGGGDNMIPKPTEVQRFLAKNGKLFQGGNAHILHTLLEVRSGDSLLYVGDHVFADVLRSKRSLGWRTCLVVPELTSEIFIYKRLRTLRNELFEMRREQYLLESRIDELQCQLQRRMMRRRICAAGTAIETRLPINENAAADIASVWAELFEQTGETSTDSKEATTETSSGIAAEKEEEIEGMLQCQKRLQALRQELEVLRANIRPKLAEYDSSFNPQWGQLFKAGFQESRFAKQIRDYACIYTSKASNLGLASPRKPYRPVRDKMPHDHFLEGF